MLMDDRKVYETHKDLHAMEELRREALLNVCVGFLFFFGRMFT